jgi:uncharacterized protein YgfB (UPF0149 family)
MTMVAERAWAIGEAVRLRGLQAKEQYSRGSFAAALTFLRVHAGAHSEFTTAAEDAVAVWDSANGPMPGWSIADALDGWANYVAAGLRLDIPEELRVRLEASGDLMEQVEALLEDQSFHPAAAVMLAGAALEEALRGLVASQVPDFQGKPGIDGYAGALRGVTELVSKQAKKFIDWAAALRNAAAHGEFENVDRSSAQAMVQGVQGFLLGLGPRS